LPELALGSPEAAQREVGDLQVLGERRDDPPAVDEVDLGDLHRGRAAGQRLVRRDQLQLAWVGVVEHRRPSIARTEAAAGGEERPPWGSPRAVEVYVPPSERSERRERKVAAGGEERPPWGSPRAVEVYVPPSERSERRERKWP